MPSHMAVQATILHSPSLMSYQVISLCFTYVRETMPKPDLHILENYFGFLISEISQKQIVYTVIHFLT